MMIKLSDTHYVAADQISEVTTNSNATHIRVKMKDGSTHVHEPQYRQGVHAALDALIAKINQTLESQK